MSELESLSPRERAERYRQLARDAERYAHNASESARHSYEVIALEWRKLADDIDNKRKH